MSSKESISVKVVIIGEPAVGKTTLRENFVGAGMQGDYLMTLGVDMAQAEIEINENLSLDAQIWDIAGQDSLETITNQFLAGTQGAIFVFDLTREYTFEKINSWLDRLHAENPELENNIPFLIIGNKSDLEIHIKTNDEDVQNYMEYVDRHHVYSKTPTEYIKTSAKTGSKVKEAFKRMGQIIIRNFQELDGTYVAPEVDTEKASQLEETLVPATSIEEPQPIVEETIEPVSISSPSPPDAPEPVSIHDLEPEPSETPVKIPEPAPAAEPEPVRVKTPEPEPFKAPVSIPTPAPEPESEPVRVETPEPEPFKAPVSIPTPAPESEPVRVETPEPEPIVEKAPEPVSIPEPKQVEQPPQIDHIPKEPVTSPFAKKTSSGGLSDDDLAELIRQKNERKKKFFERK